MNILVTGGAGYIGSHIVKYLRREGLNPIIYDNLSRGNKWALLSDYVIGDIRDTDRLLETFKRYKIDAIIHLAAFAYVEESINNPQLYFDNNTVGSIKLLNAALDYGISYFIFSSSCAVYGVPDRIPIKESNSKIPINPYGESKLLTEKILDWYAKSGRTNYISLRYFNVAGCDLEGEIGEMHFPETHIIPRVLLTALGFYPELRVYGADYDTEDGTCIRDYIHVVDLSYAHIMALRYLIANQTSDVFNLGNEKGFSVKQIVDACKDITGMNFEVSVHERRKGDPPVLIADATRAKEKIGWKPNYSDIQTILCSHWKWLHNAQKRGLIKKYL